MSNKFKIKRGLDINLKGKAKTEVQELGHSAFYALKPTDFEGLTPKLLVKGGEKVKAGTALFFDKYQPELMFTSPVSGTVEAVVRGERRRVLAVTVKPDETIEYEQFIKAKPNELDKEKVKETMLNSGLWAAIKQRPYGIIAKTNSKPKSVFISGFDSAPLAPDYEFILKDRLDDLQTGIDAISKIAEVPVYLSVHSEKNSGFFNKLSNVKINEFSGPHPSGNVGTQINKISPINKGEVVWTLNIQDLATIGALFNTGTLKATKTIVLAGSEVLQPQYYTIIAGAQISSIVGGKLSEEQENRIISGNVLTGERVEPDGYLGFYDNQITVIPEGNQPEFMAWGAPGLNKYSASRTFLSWLQPKREYVINSNMHGGERPFIVTGEMEKVFPFDIYPMQLLKAIIIEDIDLMEQLGIYEVVEEDFALCEFVNTSKIEIQEAVRKGLNLMIKEFS